MYRKPSEMHIGSIFPISSPLKLMTMIPIAREKMKNVKDVSGITSLRENGILKTDTVDKANICNKQFSVGIYA